MNTTKLLGIALILLGCLALGYGGFTYTKDVQKAKIGPVELSVKDKETVNVPVWAGVASVLAGMFLLVIRK